MTLFEALAHAAAEAAATALPISASAHRRIVQLWVGGDEASSTVAVGAAVGCVVALGAAVRRRLGPAAAAAVAALRQPGQLRSSDAGRDAVSVLIAALVSSTVQALIGPCMETFQRWPTATGLGLLLTALALVSASLAPPPRRLCPTLLGSLVVGLAHGAGIAPGGSQVGWAFVVLSWLGIRRWRAVELTFMVTVLTLTVGIVRSAWMLPDPGGLVGVTTLLAVPTALVVAGLAVVLWQLLSEQGRTSWFALWLIPLALATLGYGQAMAPVGQKSRYDPAMTDPTAYALIMAGGAGTRFWPASRRDRPKQLLPLAGSTPLLRDTATRLLELCPWQQIYVSTGSHLVAATHQLLPELTAEQLLVEPIARNTAPCIGWGAACVARQNPQAVVMALPADHHIGNQPAFRECLGQAIESAQGGTITTIGIQPTHPETGYGYIEAAEPMGRSAAHKVKRFVEKPDRARAERFVAAGNYYWNSGMFFFRACDMLDAVRAHLPDLADGLAELDAAAERGEEEQALARVFPTLPSISIDHGVMEHMSELAVVPGDFGWSDIGSWRAAAELAQTDDRGNSAPDGTVLVDAKGNHVVDLRSAAGAHTQRVIAMVGVEGLVVVETDDALLVVTQEQAQDVKQVVEQLKARGDGQLV